MAEMQQAGPSRLYTPSSLPPTSKRARAKDKLKSAQAKTRTRHSKQGDDFRRSLVMDEEDGELHDPEYAQLRNAQPARPKRTNPSSRASSISSISSIEGGFTNAYNEPSRSYYGGATRGIPGIPGVTTGVMPTTPRTNSTTTRGGRYAGTQQPSSVYSSSYLSPERDSSSYYPGTIAADSSYNPYQYHPKRYNKHTFDPPPPIREQGGRPRSITPSEVEEIPFESAYIPSLNQPSRHRSRQFAGGREEQDAMDAGCYSFKRSLTRTSLTFRFAILRWKRRSGMNR